RNYLCLFNFKTYIIDTMTFLLPLSISPDYTFCLLFPVLLFLFLVILTLYLFYFLTKVQDTHPDPRWRLKIASHAGNRTLVAGMEVDAFLVSLRLFMLAEQVRVMSIALSVRSNSGYAYAMVLGWSQGGLLKVISSLTFLWVPGIFSPMYLREMYISCDNSTPSTLKYINF
ncbi:hypothetical protein L9F63_006408, partial [Diploptera punctata]